MTTDDQLPNVGRLQLLLAYVTSAAREPKPKPQPRHATRRRRRRGEAPRPVYRDRPDGWQPADEPPRPLPPS